MPNIPDWCKRAAEQVCDECKIGAYDTQHREYMAAIIAKHAPSGGSEIRDLLARAWKYDDKPHQLFSCIRQIAVNHPSEFTLEIIRLMDKAYEEPGQVRELVEAAREALAAEHSHNRDKFSRLRRALEPFHD